MTNQNFPSLFVYRRNLLHYLFILYLILSVISVRAGLCETMESPDNSVKDETLPEGTATLDTIRPVYDSLVREAYERSKSDIRVSHLFVKVNKNPSPADTLASYKKIKDILARILGGEDFSKLAYELSDDPSARDSKANEKHAFIRGNRGDLGYLTVFDYIYPFETAAYTTKTGDVSQITRSDYGYHLIKVTDRRPAMGRVMVAHISLLIPGDATPKDSAKVKTRIESIHQKLKNGDNWDKMARQYSEDKNNAEKGGVLPQFGVNIKIPDLIQVIYQIKNIGEISDPVIIVNSWHIFKLLEKKVPGTFEEEKAGLSAKVAKSDRMKYALSDRVRLMDEQADEKKSNSPVSTSSVDPPDPRKFRIPEKLWSASCTVMASNLVLQRLPGSNGTLSVALMLNDDGDTSKPALITGNICEMVGGYNNSSFYFSSGKFLIEPCPGGTNENEIRIFSQGLSFVYHTGIGLEYISGIGTISMFGKTYDLPPDDWKMAVKADNVEAYKNYVKDNPTGGHVGEANTRIEDLSYKQCMKKSRYYSYNQFLTEFPDGKYAVKIKNILSGYKKIQFPGDTLLPEKMMVQKYHWNRRDSLSITDGKGFDFYVDSYGNSWVNGNFALGNLEFLNAKACRVSEGIYLKKGTELIFKLPPKVTTPSNPQKKPSSK